mgnify:CR=1 FL=1
MEKIAVQQMDALLALLDPFIDAIASRVTERMKASEEASRKSTEYYTRKEVAQLLGVTTRTVDEMAKRGDITSRKVGRHVLFIKDDLHNAIQEHRVFKYKHQI